MLLDTDVIIWYLRGDANAKKFLGDSTHAAISAVTYMEILQGLRNKTELLDWRSLFKDLSVRHILIDHEITVKALFWMEEFLLSHRLQIADALIAATADIYGLELVTSNVSDYQFLPNLKIKTFRPA